jgi:hypothetical protein
LKLLALCVATGPAITRAASLLGNEDVLGIIEIGVLAGLDGIDDLSSEKGYSWLQVDQDGAGNVVVVVCLVEEHVLPVLNPLIIRSVFLENAARTDPMLPAQLLPELGTD